MMNLCFLKGKVSGIIDYQFMYDKFKKNLGKKHVCIVKLQLEIKNKQIIDLKAYDEVADFVYQNVKEGDHIFLQGALKDDVIEIEEIEKID